ncbi:hypothetical protein [Chryseobacterium lineare]
MNKYTIYEPPQKGKALIKMFLARAVSMMLLLTVSFIYAQSPGGVSTNLGLWVSADSGGASWTDRSPLGTTVTPMGNPTLSVTSNNNQVNFNPAVTFNNATSYYDTGLSIARGTYANVTVFTVANGRGENGRTMFSSSSANNHRALTSNAFACGNVPTYTAKNGYGIYRASFVTGTTNASTLSFNGTQLVTTTDNNGSPITLKIGGGYYSSNSSDIAEAIVYRGTLTPDQIAKIQSYLAVKYGVTLGTSTAPVDYTNAYDVIVWTGGTSNPYQNNIAGIGRDNALSGLYQKQSQSMNGGFQPIIGNVDIAATNADNNSSISHDGDFLVWGSDTGSTAFSTAFAFGNLNYRMARTWKVQETGTIGKVKVAIPVSMWPGAVTQPTLLISDDATFDGNDTRIEMELKTIGGVQYYVTKDDVINTVNFTSGQFFSFAGFVTAPGGILGTNLWYKADQGVTVSTGVSQWNNAVGTYNLTQATSANQPAYNTANNIINFNPSVRFDGSNDLLLAANVPISEVASGSSPYSSSHYIVYRGLSTTSKVLYVSATNSPSSWNVAQTDGGLAYITNRGISSSAVAANEIRLQEFDGTSNAASSYINGLVKSSTLGAATGPSGANPFFSVGATPEGANYTNSDIAEVIVYNTAQPSGRQKIESYLAIKYGLTLGNTTNFIDYLHSAGGVIWTGNNTYQSNIAGIGRDDASALNQKQSQSTNTGIQPVIGNMDIADTNANNSNDFGADKTFMMWGSDTGSTNFATAFAFGGLNSRMARIWKVQETGTVGKVRVALKVSDLPGSVTKPTLLVSGDTTFDGSDTRIEMIKQTIGGVDYYVTKNDPSINLDFSSGQYFSFAAFVTAPGGVLGESLWLKADNGTSTTTDNSGISSWADQSTNGTNALQATSGNRPLYRSVNSQLMNFNPTVYFDGTDDYIDASSFINGSTNTLFSAIRPNIADNNNRDIIGFGGLNAGNGGELRLINGTMEYGQRDGSWTSIISGSVYGANETMLFGSSMNNIANGAKLYKNNSMVKAGTIDKFPTAANLVSIGSRTILSRAHYFNGAIPEVITHNTVLSDIERLRINSYLALKYGITLSRDSNGDNTPGQEIVPSSGIYEGDYMSSNGSTKFWSTDATYQNDIAGIGRDDASALNQKQSQSVNAGIQPVIGNVDIADTNANNGNDFAVDKSFLVWGSDTGSTSFATPFAYGSSNFRMTRIWKIQKTGTIGTVKVAIPVSQLPLVVSQPSLLISADATFDGSDTRKSMTQVSLGGVQYYVADVDGFTSGHFFSFAGFVTAPGGVAGVSLWLKADAGTNTTANDGTITSWIDQSGNNRNFGAGSGAVLFKTPIGTPGFNFNPSINFSNTSVALYSGSSLFPSPPASSATLFGVSNANGLSLLKVNNSSEPNGYAYYDYPHFGSNGLFARPSSNSAVSVTNNNFTSSISRISMGTMSGGTSVGLTINGGSFSTATGSYSTNTGAMIIGSNRWAGGDDYNGAVGNVPEIIAYTNLLNAADQKRVNSYLAIKYGITISNDTNSNGTLNEIVSGAVREGDYTSSGNNAIWDGLNNITYHNNIAGIGRDDASALFQKQSQSVNTGDQLIVGLSSVAATNAANTGTLNNLQFLMWGDNNLANTMPFSGIAGYNIRLSRVWKVQNTNNVNQDVQILVPVTTSTVPGLVPANSSLLYSTDENFGSYQKRNPIGTVTINSKEYLVFSLLASAVNQASFYMTFAFYEQSPGGVRDNIALWLRGDAGLTSTTRWVDQSSNHKDLKWDISDCAGTSRGQMTLGNTLNFNTVARFGPTTALNEWTWGFSQTSIKRTDSDGKADVAIIYKADEVKVQDVWGTDLGGIFDERSITTTQVANDNTGIGYSGGNSANATINIASFRSTENQGSNMLINGNNVLNFTGNTRYIGCETIRLGDVAGGGSGDFNPFKGLIGEFVVYKKNMSAIERMQLNSYLALKYGITLGRNNDGKLPVGDVVSASPVQIFEGDYLASDGTTKTWSSDAVYQNNVVGIGRDDISAFHQRITTSQSATPDIITLSTDSNFTNNNQSGASGHADIVNDKFFFVTGNNNGALTYSVKSGLSNDLNALMNRVWKVKKTGTAQNVYIKTSNTKATYLVYSADPTFSSGSIGYAALSGGATTLGVNIPDGNYFTFATFLEAPGGVISTFWLRAGDNFVPGSWTDYNGNGYQFTQGDPTYRPAYTANSMNFNPTAYFNGNNFMSMTTFNGFLNNDMRNPHSFATALRTSTNNSTIINFEGTQTVTRQGDWDYLDNGGYSIDDQCRCSQPTYGGANLTDYNYSMIGTLTFSGGISATSGSIKYYRDGKRLSTASINPSSQAYGLTSNTRLGYRYGGVGGFLNGYLAEQVVFAKSLSDLEVTAVNSYMALKYGNTLSRDQDGDGTSGEPVSGLINEGDYIASDHTTKVWSSDLTYQNNIIGLAKDRTSTLHQRIARSQMPVSDIITLSTDNNFTNANESGASGHTDIANDMYFFITGHNGQPVTFTLKSGLSNSLSSIMSRVWKVQQTGTAQNLYVKVNNVRAKYLIYSPDPTFSSGVGYAKLDNDAASGTSVTHDAVQIPSGNYFTFAAPLNGPGGVNDNLVRWYRADRDVVNGSTLTWKDQTVTEDAKQDTAANQPVYNTSGASLLNFNPSFSFDAGQSKFMFFKDTGLASSNSARSVFGVGTTSSTTAQWLTSYGTSSAGKNFGLISSGSNVMASTYGTGNEITASGTSPYLYNTPVVSYGAVAGSTLYGAFNAFTPQNMTASSVSTALSSNSGRIGTDQSGSNYWNGTIGEVVYYNKIPTLTEKARIDSYLGLKYGVTLGNNSSPFSYVGSDGNTVWTGSTAYQNNIAGIGRDDISDLAQKQSQSQDQTKTQTLAAPLTSVPQVIIGLGNVAAANEANTSEFENNLQFLVWGDNNAGLEGSTTSFTAVYPYQERLSRVWRVQNTKSLAKDIQVLIPAAYIKDLKVSSLLYSTSATFPAGSSVLSSSSTSMVTINSVDYKAFTIPATQVNQSVFYFTMAYYKKSPGGVAGENLWLRADDDEIMANADDTSVATWKDQSGNNSHGTQATSGQQPKYRNNATDNMNFNPVLKFTGNSTVKQSFDITGTLGIDGQKNVAVFAVSDVLGAHYFLQPKLAGGNLLQFSSAGAGYVTLTLGGSSATNTTAVPSGGSAELYAGWRTAAGDVLYSGINAKQLNTAANTTVWTGGNLVLGIDASGNYTNGKIPEIVEYSSSLDATQLQKVNSYLALKYGITINQSTTGQDYLASDGNKSWTADATYKYNIAGIGRDDLTALNQKQSQSVNADSQMVVALGSAEAGNSANTNTFSADMQYLVWGDDNGSLTTKVATGNVTANGLTYTKRFSRVWKAQNKGSFASDIKVYFPVSAFGTSWPSSVGLIYASTAAKLNDGTASVIMNNGTQTINGVSYYAFPVEASKVSSLNYLSFTTATSVCYKPAVTAGTALGTKAGITALGRAGVNADNWPMVRKGGWMALEAKTKGMIINRVRFKNFGSDTTPDWRPVADNDTTPILTSPVEGMIVMDLTNRMLKVYTVKNGVSGWYEIGQQTCPD